jgi:hypothetical protein
MVSQAYSNTKNRDIANTLIRDTIQTSSSNPNSRAAKAISTASKLRNERFAMQQAAKTAMDNEVLKITPKIRKYYNK